MTDRECAFCSVVSGAVKPYLVHQDPWIVALLDNRPIRPGHVLVLPRTHEPDVFKLDDGIYVRVMRTAKDVAARLERIYRPRKVGMLVAGFDVPHAHVHVIPMHEYHDVTSKVVLEGKRLMPSHQELEEQAEIIRRGPGR